MCLLHASIARAPHAVLSSTKALLLVGNRRCAAVKSSVRRCIMPKVDYQMSRDAPSVTICPKNASAVANVGSTWAECWTSLLAGRQYFAPVQRFFSDLPLGPPVAGIE